MQKNKKRNKSKSASIAQNWIIKFAVFIAPSMPNKPNGVASVLHAKRCHELESAITFNSRPSSPHDPALPPWLGCPIGSNG